MKGYQTSALAILLLAIGSLPARANLVTDPGFESCTMVLESPPPGWSTTSANIFCSVNAHSGTWDADLTGATSTLSQTITTTPGGTYDFSFWLRSAAETPNNFTASFGTDQVLDLVNAGTSAYTFEDFTATAAAASTTIAFTASANGGAWPLDDVSVTPVQAAVPEPASLTLLAASLLGLVGLGAVRRRRLAN